ncbi:PDZ domain-containing protein [Mucilaginibacter pallidiroseus]|uniref:PDZ domain-containing protein n=1 Tax=Mucilaginibacter pallidiroseus TaxID=2599295 RepID=A0A563UGR5_9SPHI|nr:aspartyl protease family protein [Mucilaginibacter pallidiroseus]TWR30590.1 PDZ domain-containing protein [Mucilaginibacter pallidiroseus]
MFAYRHFRSKVHLLLTALFCYLSAALFAQSFKLDDSTDKVTLPFKAVRNMVVVQLRINSKGPFNFLLDTGVGIMIITEPGIVDSLSIAHKRKIRISGLGDGEDYEAQVTSVLDIQMPGLHSEGVAAAVLKQDYFNLSSYAGMPIHGIVGYDFFNSLAVKLSFRDSTVTVCRPKDLRGIRKYSWVPLSIEDKKPYIQTLITLPNGNTTHSKFVVDLGAGHPLLLENMIAKSGLPAKFIVANLGVAINGPIKGYLSRVKELSLGRYKLKDVLTSFPDDPDTTNRYKIARDGNIGIGILKKFDVVFDYSNSSLYLKANKQFKQAYEYDMSGLEYFATGKDYSHVVISRVAPGSPAFDAGLEKGDEIMSINLKPVSKMSIEEIDNFFKSRNERTLLLDIFHDNRYDKVIITLKRRI